MDRDRDRDRRQGRTLQASTRAPSARPVNPNWDDDAPMPSDPVAAMSNVRSRVNTAGKISESTLARVDDLRKEFRADLERVDSKVDGVEGKVDRVDGKVDDLHDKFTTVVATSARMEGQLSILVERASQDHRDLSAARTSAIQARIEVEKTERIEQPKFQREVKMRVLGTILAGLGALGAAILTAILSGRC